MRYHSTGRKLAWIADLRYLGVYFVKCIEHWNALWMLPNAGSTEQLIVLLVKLAYCLWGSSSAPYYVQWMPILLYGSEALPLNKRQLSCLDFMVNRFLMKRNYLPAMICKLYSFIDSSSILNCRVLLAFSIIWITLVTARFWAFSMLRNVVCRGENSWETFIP